MLIFIYLFIFLQSSDLILTRQQDKCGVQMFASAVFFFFLFPQIRLFVQARKNIFCN